METSFHPETVYIIFLLSTQIHTGNTQRNPSLKELVDFRGSRAFCTSAPSRIWRASQLVRPWTWTTGELGTGEKSRSKHHQTESRNHMSCGIISCKVCGWKGPLWIILCEFSAAVAMKHLEPWQGKESQQSNQELREIPHKFLVFFHLGKEGPPEWCHFWGLQCLGQNFWCWMRWSLWTWPSHLEFGARTSGSRWSKFPAKSFNPLGNTSLRLSQQCKHMIFAYIFLKTPLEFQTPSCCNGIQNWKSAVCLLAKVNSHTCWCIEIALCNHR